MRRLQLGRGLSSRDRRAISAGLLVVAPALSYFFIVKPYGSSVRRTLDALDGQRALLEREEAVVRRRVIALREANAAAAVASGTTSRTYAGVDSVLTLSAFGRDVTTLLSDAGLAVQRVETRDSVTRHGALREFTVDVRAQGDFESVLSALTRLEAHTRLVRVSRLSIETSGERQPSGTDVLSLVAVLHGYAQ